MLPGLQLAKGGQRDLKFACTTTGALSTTVAWWPITGLMGRAWAVASAPGRHGHTGFSGSRRCLSIKATPYMYRSYKLLVPIVQIYSGVAQLPWFMKPIIELISGNLSIAAYHKAVGVVTATLQRLSAAWTEKGYVVQSEHNHVTNLGVGINKAHKVVKIPVIPLRCY